MSHSDLTEQRRIAPLYRPDYERDSCGVGLVVNIAGTASREIVERALGGLVNLTHRGGIGADERTGDGAGLLTQLPHAIFAPALVALGAGDLAAGDYGVAMIFLPRHGADAAHARETAAEAVESRGLTVVGWREIEVDPSVLGRIAALTQPGIGQLLIAKPAELEADAFERELLLARKAAERAVSAAGI